MHCIISMGIVNVLPAWQLLQLFLWYSQKHVIYQRVTYSFQGIRNTEEVGYYKRKCKQCIFMIPNGDHLYNKKGPNDISYYIYYSITLHTNRKMILKLRMECSLFIPKTKLLPAEDLTFIIVHCFADKEPQHKDPLIRQNVSCDIC